MDRRLGGHQNRSGLCGEEKNSQPLPGLEPPIIQPLAQSYTAELPRLLVNKFLPFIEPDGLLPCSQEPVISDVLCNIS
jgi:hypothetical protein